METSHSIYYANGTIYKFFLASDWYDTATPAKYCINELNEVWQTIQAGNSLIIKSNNETYQIESTHDFRFWLKTVFKGGFEEFVGK